MTTPDPDGDLVRDALDGAVAGVEPVDRLGAIQARTAQPSRRGRYVAGGAVLAAAAVVVAVAVVATGDGERDGVHPGDAGTASSAPAGPGDAAVEPPAATTPVYYVGPGSDGPEGTDAALYRYFEPEGDPLELLMSRPSDPDYRTLWPEGSLLRYAVSDTAIVVTASAEPADDADLARQQLVYTMQAVLGSTRPVELSLTTGNAVGARIVRSDPIDVLSHVNISDPGERYAYSGSFTARGTGTGYEGNVACRLVGEDGDVAWAGATIAGTEDRFAEWTLDVDLTGLAAGGYAFVCSTEDPSGGAEGGPGGFTDNRTIYVQQPAGDASSATSATPTYYVGPGPDGPDAPRWVLYPEYPDHDGDPLSVLMRAPSDPDYRTLWPEGSLVAYGEGDGRITVAVAGGPVDDELARQQLYATLNAGPGQDRPVELEWADGGDAEQPLITGAAPLAVMSHMSITQPAEGTAYADSFTAAGLANGWEGGVFCELYDTRDRAVRSGATTNGGLLDAKITPWRLAVDLSGIDPGVYTFRCQTDDPTGGTEGRGVDVDTRSITVT